MGQNASHSRSFWSGSSFGKIMVRGVSMGAHIVRQVAQCRAALASDKTLRAKLPKKDRPQMKGETTVEIQGSSKHCFTG